MIRKALFLLLCAPAAWGLTVGELPVGGGGSYLPGITGTPLTLIALSRPALANGTLTHATFVWDGAPSAGCANAIKLKFLRRSGSNGAINVIADRGPLQVRNGINTVVLSPPVTVEKGDVMAITLLGLGNACGGIRVQRAEQEEVYGTTFSDPAGAVTQVNIVNGTMIAIAASSAETILHGIVVAAGSAPGNFGSFFKTGMQLTNPGLDVIRGKLVFHPAGMPAQASDPSLEYTLFSKQTRSYDDVVAAMGAVGLGSIDLVLTSGYPPNVTTRIFNDAGAAGTSGLNEDLQTPHRAFFAGDRGTISIPADLSTFRLNVGYRTLDEGARIVVSVYNSGGVLQNTSGSIDLGANTFNQISGAQFAAVGSLPAGGSISFSVTSGSLFVYGAVTDNRTNDGSLTFAKRW